MEGMSAPAAFLAHPGRPPVPFRQWKFAFDTYLLAIGGKNFDQDRQKAVLLHCLSPEGQRIFQTIPEMDRIDDESDLEYTMRKLEGHFEPQVNPIAERFKFRQRRQREEESTADFVADLRGLAANCAFQDMADEMIRDQVVEATIHDRLRERFLQDSKLTLASVLAVSEAYERSKQEARSMVSQDQEEITANHVRQHHGQGQRSSGPSHQPQTQPAAGAQPKVKRQGQPREGREGQPGGRREQPGERPPPGDDFKCYGCGMAGDHYPRDPACPAKGKTCHKCGKKNHLAKMCKGPRPVHSVSVMSIRQQQLPQSSTLKREVVLEGGKHVQFIVDTGSPVILVPRDVLSKGVVLLQADKKLCGYGGPELDVLGMAKVHVPEIDQEVSVYVVPQGNPIMGLDMMRMLGVNVVNGEVCTVNPTPTDSKPAINGYVHKVTVHPTVRPVQQPLRRLPFAVRDEVTAKLAEMEAAGIIERVDASPWVSPIVVSRKRNGKVRLCLDLRKVNQAVVTDGYPLPHMDELLHALKGSKVYTILDLKEAYHQVELHPDSRNLTAFITHEGLFRYRRVPMGLASSGPCFQRIMEDMLKGIKGVTVYLDDVVVHGATTAEHDRTLKRVETLFQTHRVQVNEEKCRRAQKEISFLGLKVSADKLEVDPERLRPLLEMPEPESHKDLRSLLGSLGFYSRFVPRYTEKTAVLRDALMAEDWVWNESHAKAVKELKGEIASASSLTLYDPSLRTVVTTDASDIGCGAYLSQFKADGEEVVVAYTSKKFSQAECNYSVVEKEALGCVYAVEKWRPFLWGRRFLLRTDNQALTSVFGTKGSTRVGRRIARWEARLLDFSFDIVHIRTEQNPVADGLSRMPVTDDRWNDDDAVEVAVVAADQTSAVSEAELRQASASDPVLTQVRACLKAGRWNAEAKADLVTRPFFQVRAELSCKDELMFRGDRCIAPTGVRGRLLELAHETHPGVVRTKQRLRERYWWPGMDGEIESLLRNCTLCSAHGKSAKSCRPPVQRVPMPAGPWTKVVIDAIGPLKGAASERFGLVLVDAYSRWPEVAFMPHVTSSLVIDFLQAVFSKEGIPQELLCDNGSVFTSRQFRDFCEAQGVKLIHSSPYSPQTCGLVERFNRTVKDALETARLTGQSRATFVRSFLQTYRATSHPATGTSPFHAMRGRDMRTKLGAPGAGGDSHPDQVRSHFQVYQDRYLARCNDRTGELPQWKVGDVVRVRAPFGWKRRFGPPLTIRAQLGPVTFRLSDGQKAHARRLAAARKLQPEQASADEEAWYPAQETESGTAHPVPTPATPATPVPRQGRGMRVRRVPDRYSP